MIVLVTGAAGFIGSHLCDDLLKKGYNVIGLDDFCTGNKDNIKHLINDNFFKLVKHDILQPISFQVDQIYNLACPASPDYYLFNPVKTIKASVIGTINVLEIAKQENARILQASTSEVYGDPEKHPQKEDYLGRVNTVGPRSCYDEGKRVAESLMINYHKQYKVDIRIARIFNTYGPRMATNDGRVISNFICQALKDESITIYGNGEQTRSFCYISDLITGIIKIMEQREIIGPINLGKPDEISVIELAHMILELTNSKSKIVFEERPEGDPMRRKPDISFAKERINWNPVVDLKEGLKRTIQYFENILPNKKE